MVRIAVSMGDPLGIGPEVVVAALATPTVRNAAEIVVHGDARTLQRAAALRGVPLECEIVQIGSLEPDPAPREAGASALEYVRRAARACMDGRAGALCTAPLSKQRVAAGERGFVGHTEYLAAMTGARVAMTMLPLGNSTGMSEWRYTFLRNCFFAGSHLSLVLNRLYAKIASTKTRKRSYARPTP